VVVYSMNALATPRPPADGADAAADTPAAMAAPAPAKAAAPARNVALVLAALAVAVAAIGFGLVVRRKPAPARLTAAEREQMLRDVRQWIAAPATDAAGRRP
jgi:flagellar M-ring protein FliF